MCKTVAVIGLGYVGLPLACLCAKKGYTVYGVDKDPSIVKKTKSGISHIKDKVLEKDLKKLKGKIIATMPSEEAITKSDVILVCVPTPVTKEFKPNLSFVKSTCEYISKYLKDGQLVIIESTIYPGTSEEVIKPILDKSNKKYFLVHCPERIDPGNKQYTIKNIPRVLGGLTKEGAEKAKKFYQSILDAKVTVLKSIKEAEAVKVAENSFRDINIAFVNELARSFEVFGIDIDEVIKGASSKPFGFLPHYPGCGVGGHCIPVDPYYLIEQAKHKGFDHKFLSLAREINKSMPRYTIDLLIKELKKLNASIEKAKVGILGIAYKANIDDFRESPYFEIKKILGQKGAKTLSFDPWIRDKSDVDTLEGLFKKVDFLILCTNHNEFINLDYNLLKKHKIKIIIDGRNCLDKNKIKSLGITYRGIGR